MYSYLMNPIDFSYHIINKYSKLSPDGITPLKLQKLLYYIYAWGVTSNNKLLTFKFKKWTFGPVNPEVYYHFKSFSGNPIPTDKSKKVTLLVSQSNFVEFIVSNYIKFDAITLSAMTHKDLPWQNTPTDEVIKEKSIKKFYGKLNFAKNFPLGKNKKFYPVETDLHYSFILDMPKNIAEQTFSFDSYKEYLELATKSKKDFDKQIKKWLQQ